MLRRLDARIIRAVDAVNPIDPIDIDAADLRLTSAQAGQPTETQQAKQAPVVEPAVVFLFLSYLRGLRRLCGGLLRYRRTCRQ